MDELLVVTANSAGANVANTVVAYAGSVICLGIIIFLAVKIFINYSKNGKKINEKFVQELKGMKWSRFVPVYSAVFLMCLTGRIYAEANITFLSVLVDFLKSIGSAISMVALQLDYDSISDLFKVNGLFAFTVIICYLAAVMNSLLEVYLLLNTYRFKHSVLNRWKKAKRKVLIIGNNPDNKDIYMSAPGNNRECECALEHNRDEDTMYVIADKLDKSEESKLAISKIAFFNTDKTFKYKSKNEKSGDKNYSGSERIDGPEDIYIDELNKALESNRRRFNPEDNTENKDAVNCGEGDEFTVIVNTGNDENNLKIVYDINSRIVQYIKGLPETREKPDPDKPHKQPELDINYKRRVIDLFEHFKVYVFGDPRYEALYINIVNASSGVIRYINKYRQIAIDFIKEHPLTEHMTAAQLNYNTFLIKDAIDVNVTLIGFGKTNRELFLASVANNQFLDSKECLKKVKYHIFDKEETQNNKNLNHSYYRYRNEFFKKDIVKKLSEGLAGEAEETEKKFCPAYPYDDSVIKEGIIGRYLPLPELPAEEYYHNLDINDTEFYNSLHGIIGGKNKFNYIVISFGTDLENIDLARKLIEKRNEWKSENKESSVTTFIFVKVRNQDNNVLVPDDNCFVFGNEKTIVYNYNNIIASEIMKMAHKRNKVYDFAKAHSYNSGSDDKVKIIKSTYKWYADRTQTERDSNIYAVLSLRSKLHMMGFDYSNAKGAKAVDKRTYFEVYGKNDPMIGSEGERKETVSPEDYKNTLRRRMAILEHCRWNSFMISRGTIPASIDEIKEDSENHGKDYDLRRHGNLTTFDGLKIFYDLVVKTDKDAADVIKYDYDILDEIFGFLASCSNDENNYVLIKREN